MGLTKEHVPEHGIMVRNIVGTYFTAGERDLENGTSWYPNTLKYCQKIADEFGYDVERVVAAYAIISPSLDKEKNDEQIRVIVECHSLKLPPVDWPPVGVYGMRNRNKCDAALSGDLTAVRGPKVTAFFNNIMGRPHDPTVDRWAIRVALNDPYLPEKQAIPGGKAVHTALCDAYREAADIIGMVPSVVQAVTWETFRNTYYAATGPNGSRQKKLRQLKDDGLYEKVRKDAGIQ